MRIAYIIGTAAVAGIFGTGVYFGEEIKNSVTAGMERFHPPPPPLTQPAQQQLPSAPAEAPTKDAEPDKTIHLTPGDRLNRIESLTRDLFQEIKGLGKEKSDEVYSQAKETLRDLESGICQESLQELAKNVEGTIEPYLQRTSCSYETIKLCFQQLSESARQDLLVQGYQRLTPKSKDEFIREKGLEFWLDALSRNFEVHISQEQER